MLKKHLVVVRVPDAVGNSHHKEEPDNTFDENMFIMISVAMVLRHEFPCLEMNYIT